MCVSDYLVTFRRAEERLKQKRIQGYSPYVDDIFSVVVDEKN